MSDEVVIIKNQKYIKKTLLKKGDQGITEIVEDKDGRQYVHKSIPYGGLPYQQLKSAGIYCIPHIYVVEESRDICDERTTEIIEELIPGENLENYIKRRGTCPESIVKDFILDLCDILIELHGEGILHRDIKPSNIMLRPCGRLCLIDFGAARSFRDKNEDGRDHDTRIMVTHHYAAPEQYGSGQTTPASDIYSLGVTMAEMLPKDYDGYLYPILQQCQKKDPSQRYTDVLSLKEAVLNEDPYKNALHIAALNGDSKAQYEYGCYCRKNREYPEAIIWFERAYGQRRLETSYRASSAYEIGYIYHRNFKNWDAAEVWYQLASDLGSNEGYLALKEHYEHLKRDEAVLDEPFLIKLKHNPLSTVVILLSVLVIFLLAYVAFDVLKPISKEARDKADSALKKGVELFIKQDYSGAITELSSGIVLNTNNPELYLYRAACYITRPNADTDEYLKGLEDCNNCIKTGVSSLDYKKTIYLYSNKAIAEMKLLDYDSAIISASKVIQLSKDNKVIDDTLAGNLCYRGAAYARIGKTNEALKDFNEALAVIEVVRRKKEPNVLIESGIYHQRGNLYSDNLKDYSLAIEDYNMAIKIDPMQPLLYCNRGYVYWKNLGRKADALKEFNQALAIDPNNTHAASLKMEILNEMSDSEKASAVLVADKEITAKEASSVELNSNKVAFDGANLKSKIVLPELMVKKSSYVFNAANEPARRITEDDLKAAKRFAQLADEKFNKKDYELAEFYITQAINKDYSNPKYYYARAFTRVLKPNAVKADNNKVIEDCSKFLHYGRNTAQDFEYGDIYHLKGVAHQNLSEFAEANDCFAKAIKSNRFKSLIADMYCRKGLCLRALKNYDEALEDYDRGISVVNELKESGQQYNKYTEANAYNQKGIIFGDYKQNYTKALECFNKAIEIAPNIAIYYSNRGSLYHVHFNDKENALKDYDKALEIVPDLPNIKAARQLILTQMHK